MWSEAYTVREDRGLPKYGLMRIRRAQMDRQQTSPARRHCRSVAVACRLAISRWTKSRSSVAGSLGKKKIVPAGAGTLPTHTPSFVGLLVGVVMLVGALTFVPALALGPIVEHLTLIGAR